MQVQGVGDFNAVTWLMVLYPRSVQKEIPQSTFEAMRTSLRTSHVEQKLTALNCLPRYSTNPEAASSYLRSEHARWGEAVRLSGVKLEG
jgi:tripartite-type tricarboxylate transporter receptor subunit TctC